ncbi:hypothetical protein BaRGS_00003913 [Batillaria attramentaria]|uniref:Uncharacterized protein n=1 Tax=Batillaria attramentaria TaxID=370345 RepID=A0ABD0M054_9CAEN
MTPNISDPDFVVGEAANRATCEISPLITDHCYFIPIILRHCPCDVREAEQTPHLLLSPVQFLRPGQPAMFARRGEAMIPRSDSYAPPKTSTNSRHGSWLFQQKYIINSYGSSYVTHPSAVADQLWVETETRVTKFNEIKGKHPGRRSSANSSHEPRFLAAHRHE